MTGFALDPRLEAETLALPDLPLSAVRLMLNVAWPWLILVPRLPAITQLTDLAAADRAALMEEIAAASDALQAVAPCDRINIGAIGNVVPQLHIHVVARRRDDPLWPKPVWGAAAPAPYPPGAAEAMAARIAARLTPDMPR